MLSLLCCFYDHFVKMGLRAHSKITGHFRGPTHIYIIRHTFSLDMCDYTQYFRTTDWAYHSRAFPNAITHDPTGELALISCEYGFMGLTP